uniref:Fluorothreonine transaldolase n=1 Tax=Candidatus Kentrum sp. DK TaxID=2126562 RepID=A0A450T1A6_9GAMM|nr:MAG: fluorothreonine transaldolase [Candidatus Kentron sp. DK]VFJ68869.1 MAG: fluorothreonine transaldolase [Candidatus Kentron sp. DK]
MLSLPEISYLIAEEEAASRGVLHLTANETLLSPQAQRVLASPLYNRYLLEHVDLREDSPSRLGGFLFRGLDNVNAIERSALEVCKALFHADYAEFRCLSGLHAMQTTLASLTRPGDKVMRFAIKDGGHFATQHLLKLLGRGSCCYVVNRESLEIDLEETARVFAQERPTLLYIDAMNYLFPFPLGQLKEIVGEEVPLVFDASHTLGLIAGGKFQNPLKEGADLLQANTHKTFFGPQKGIILTNRRELYEKISYDLSQGLVSSQHTSSSLALFVALHEMREYGRVYAERVIHNARYFAGKLHEKGMKVLGAGRGFTGNHQFFIDSAGMAPAPVLMERLLLANIAVNRTVPFEKVDALRLGVQEVTRRGFGDAEFDQIADWFAALLLAEADPRPLAGEVSDFVRARERILYCDEYCDEAGCEESAPAGSSSPGQGRAGKAGEVGKAGEGGRGGLPDAAPLRVGARWVGYRRLEEEFRVPAPVFSHIRELAEIASRYPQQTDGAGNISAAWEGKIYVTTSGSFIGNLGEEDVVELVSAVEHTIAYRGEGFPSSEADMHYLLLEATGSRFAVHNHYLPSDREMAQFGIGMIPPRESGSIALARAVAEASRAHKIIYLQKHGLVFHAPTLEECKALLNALEPGRSE